MNFTQWITLAQQFLPRFIAAATILIGTLLLRYILLIMLKRSMATRDINEEVMTLTSRATSFLVIMLGTISALDAVKFNVIHFITGLGLAGFTIGIALKSATEDIVSGVLLLLHQPFRKGDYVRLGDLEGTVTQVHLRKTHLILNDGLIALLPNSNIYNNTIINLSTSKSRRLHIMLNILPNIDLHKFPQELIKQCLSQTKGVFRVFSKPRTYHSAKLQALA